MFVKDDRKSSLFMFVYFKCIVVVCILFGFLVFIFCVVVYVVFMCGFDVMCEYLF